MKNSFLMIMLLAVIGCAVPPTAEEIAHIGYGFYPSGYREMIQDHLNEALFDPYTAHIKIGAPHQFCVKSSPLRGGKVQCGYLVRVECNAKNRFGAYTGTQLSGFFFRNGILLKVYEEYAMRQMNQAQ